MHLHRVWEGRKTSPQSLPALAWPIGVGNITVLRLQGGAAGGGNRGSGGLHSRLLSIGSGNTPIATPTLLLTCL